MSARLDKNLLEQFLGFVLDTHKAGSRDRSTAIDEIAHLALALDLGPKGEDPNVYMRNILKGENE